MTVPDFKNSIGKWVRTFTVDNKTVYTKSGMTFHGLQGRTNSAGVFQNTQLCYKGCSHTFKDFQEFAEWCNTQKGFKEDFQLDKDLLFKNNKIYSPETCVFLPREINKALIRMTCRRGMYPIGVTVDKKGIRAKCADTLNNRIHLIGYFTSVEEAFEAYKSYKECVLKSLAEKWKDQIDSRAYNALMSYTVEITD